jgi:hypothetical protein
MSGLNGLDCAHRNNFIVCSPAVASFPNRARNSPETPPQSMDSRIRFPVSSTADTSATTIDSVRRLAMSLPWALVHLWCSAVTSSTATGKATSRKISVFGAGLYRGR